MRELTWGSAFANIGLRGVYLVGHLPFGRRKNRPSAHRRRVSQRATIVSTDPYGTRTIGANLRFRRKVPTAPATDAQLTSESLRRKSVVAVARTKSILTLAAKAREQEASAETGSRKVRGLPTCLVHRAES